MCIDDILQHAQIRLHLLDVVVDGIEDYNVSGMSMNVTQRHTQIVDMSDSLDVSHSFGQ